jgi:hypothetical protein
LTPAIRGGLVIAKFADGERGTKRSHSPALRHQKQETLLVLPHVNERGNASMITAPQRRSQSIDDA